MGLQSKLSAAKAAEFSFLLAIPIILGASLWVLVLDGGLGMFRKTLRWYWWVILSRLGAILLAVSFLIKLLGTSGLKWFGWYRIGLAGVLTVLLLTGVI